MFSGNNTQVSETKEVVSETTADKMDLAHYFVNPEECSAQDWITPNQYWKERAAVDLAFITGQGLTNEQVAEMKALDERFQINALVAEQHGILARQRGLQTPGMTMSSAGLQMDNERLESIKKSLTDHDIAMQNLRDRAIKPYRLEEDNLVKYTYKKATPYEVQLWAPSAPKTAKDFYKLALKLLAADNKLKNNNGVHSVAKKDLFPVLTFEKSHHFAKTYVNNVKEFAISLLLDAANAGHQAAAIFLEYSHFLIEAVRAGQPEAIKRIKNHYHFDRIENKDRAHDLTLWSQIKAPATIEELEQFAEDIQNQGSIGDHYFLQEPSSADKLISKLLEEAEKLKQLEQDQQQRIMMEQESLMQQVRQSVQQARSSHQHRLFAPSAQSVVNDQAAAQQSEDIAPEMNALSLKA